MVDLTPLFPNLRVMEAQKISFCGVACLADSIRFVLGKDISQDEIGTQLQVDPEEGTPHHKMFQGGKFYGMRATEIHDPKMTLVDLAKELEKPNTRIILNIMPIRSADEGGTLEAELEEGHYVIFEGLAKIGDQTYAIYNNPDFPASIQFYKLEEAEKRWYDYVPQLNNKKIEHWALILSKPE